MVKSKRDIILERKKEMKCGICNKQLDEKYKLVEYKKNGKTVKIMICKHHNVQ